MSWKFLFRSCICSNSIDRQHTLNSHVFKRMGNSTYLHVTRRCRIFNLDKCEVKNQRELRFLVHMLSWLKWEFQLIKRWMIYLYFSVCVFFFIIFILFFYIVLKKTKSLMDVMCFFCDNCVIIKYGLLFFIFGCPNMIKYSFFEDFTRNPLKSSKWRF